MTILINQVCECIKGKKDTFVKRGLYLVHYAYQLPCGEMMVNVQNDYNESINCYAKRFKLPNAIFAKKI